MDERGVGMLGTKRMGTVGMMVAVLALGTVIQTVSMPIPAAAAKGCTLAEGSIVAANCNETFGSGLTPRSGRNEYRVYFDLPDLGIQALTRQTSKWKYWPSGGSAYSYKTITATNYVLLPAFPYWIDWQSPGTMKDGTQFCSTQMNAATGWVYSNYACLTMKK